jgi:methionyl-tRNA synthetase
METVLYVTAEVVRVIALLIQPYMPGSAAKLLDLLAVPADARQFANIATPLVSGMPLPAPSGIFPRYVEPEAEAKKA